MPAVGAGISETRFIQCRWVTLRASPACTATSRLTSPAEPWERASGATSPPLPCPGGSRGCPLSTVSPRCKRGRGQEWVRARGAGGRGHLRSCSGSPAGHCTRELSLCDAGTPARACPVLRWRISQRSLPKRETRPGVKPAVGLCGWGRSSANYSSRPGRPCLRECRARFLASRPS